MDDANNHPEKYAFVEISPRGFLRRVNARNLDQKTAELSRKVRQWIFTLAGHRTVAVVAIVYSTLVAVAELGALIPPRWSPNFAVVAEVVDTSGGTLGLLLSPRSSLMGNS
jgi:hypothetical protein